MSRLDAPAALLVDALLAGEEPTAELIALAVDLRPPPRRDGGRRRRPARYAWQPYEGPRGGKGWYNPDTGLVVYRDEPPPESAPQRDDESFPRYVGRLSDEWKAFVRDANLVQLDEEAVYAAVERLDQTTLEQVRRLRGSIGAPEGGFVAAATDPAVRALCAYDADGGDDGRGLVPAGPQVNAEEERMLTAFADGVELNRGERTAFYTYCGYRDDDSGYTEQILQAGRGDTADPAAVDIARRMDGVLDRLPPLPRPVTTYRGIHVDPAERQALLAELHQAAGSGQPVDFPTFTSTSLSPYVAYRFAGGNQPTTLQFRLRLGKGLPLWGISEAAEYEIMPPRRSRYRVAGFGKGVVAGDDGTAEVDYVDLEQLDD